MTLPSSLYTAHDELNRVDVHGFLFVSIERRDVNAKRVVDTFICCGFRQ